MLRSPEASTRNLMEVLRAAARLICSRGPAGGRATLCAKKCETARRVTQRAVSDHHREGPAKTQHDTGSDFTPHDRDLRHGMKRQVLCGPQAVA